MEQSHEPRGERRPQPGVWRFGEAELHEPGGRLHAGGQARTLERSSHEILRYLLEHAGEVVSKEELLQAGWPGRVVAENSLAKAISRLRTALGPSSDVLRAIHGYGYRLDVTAQFMPAMRALPGQEGARSIPAGAEPTRERLRAEAVERQSRQLAELEQRRRWMRAGIAMLGVFLLVSLWQQWRVQQARDGLLAATRLAQENAAIADAVNRFFNQDVLGAASPYALSNGREPTIQEAIEHAAANIGMRLRDQPVVEASVRMTIGQVYGEAMNIDRAIEQERIAVALFEKHLGPADVRTQRARYQLAADLTDDSRFDEAWRLIEETDALRRRLGLADPETTLSSHRASCYWHIWREQYDAGLPACEGAIAAQLQVDPNARNELIKTRTNLAVLHSRAGRFEQAEAQFSRIEADFAALGDGSSPTWLRATYLHGMNLVALARYEQAAVLLDAVYRGSVAALGAENPHALEVEMGLAELFMRRGRPAEALPLLQHAHSSYARQFGDNNHYTRGAREALAAARCAAGMAGPGSKAQADVCT